MDFCFLQLSFWTVAAVYGSTHPEYAKYLYVMAPISLVLLNPLGFLFLELGERRKVAQRAAQVKASYTNLSQSSSSVATNSGKTSAADKNGWKVCFATSSALYFQQYAINNANYNHVFIVVVLSNSYFLLFGRISFSLPSSSWLFWVSFSISLVNTRSRPYWKTCAM